MKIFYQEITLMAQMQTENYRKQIPQIPQILIELNWRADNGDSADEEAKMDEVLKSGGVISSPAVFPLSIPAFGLHCNRV